MREGGSVRVIVRVLPQLERAHVLDLGDLLVLLQRRGVHPLVLVQDRRGDGDMRQ